MYTYCVQLRTLCVSASCTHRRHVSATTTLAPCERGPCRLNVVSFLTRLLSWSSGRRSGEKAFLPYALPFAGRLFQYGSKRAHLSGSTNCKRNRLTASSCSPSRPAQRRRTCMTLQNARAKTCMPVPHRCRPACWPKVQCQAVGQRHNSVPALEVSRRDNATQAGRIHRADADISLQTKLHGAAGDLNQAADFGKL